MDRLPMLRQMAQARPDDPFVRYGLAMELRKRGEPEVAEAIEVFESLLADHPSYVPSYLMFGTLLVERGERERAAAVLTRGIEAARAAADEHALSELTAARAELP
ncbi:MAG: tetratricopeptide repeat protein [Myxococcota bacterium]